MVYLPIKIWGSRTKRHHFEVIGLPFFAHKSKMSVTDPSDRFSIYFGHPHILSPIEKSWKCETLPSVNSDWCHEVCANTDLYGFGKSRNVAWAIWVQCTFWHYCRRSWGPFTGMAGLSIACTLGVTHLPPLPPLFHSLSASRWMMVHHSQWWLPSLYSPPRRTLPSSIHIFTTLMTPYGSCFSTWGHPNHFPLMPTFSFPCFEVDSRISRYVKHRFDSNLMPFETLTLSSLHVYEGVQLKPTESKTINGAFRDVELW